MNNTQFISQAIKTYFTLGLTHKKILYLLAHEHNIFINERTVRRRLSKIGLFRRKCTSNMLAAALFTCILQETETCGRQLGYRFMHSKC